MSITQRLGKKTIYGWTLTMARLGLMGALAQVSVGLKEIYALVERSFGIGIQMLLPWGLHGCAIDK